MGNFFCLFCFDFVVCLFVSAVHTDFLLIESLLILQSASLTGLVPHLNSKNLTHGGIQGGFFSLERRQKYRVSAVLQQLCQIRGTQTEKMTNENPHTWLEVIPIFPIAFGSRIMLLHLGK